MSLISLLLQADTMLPAPVAPPAANAPDSISVFYLLKQGGILMIPLLICSILMVYISLERYFAIRKAGALDPTFMHRIREQVLMGNLESARLMARKQPAPEARIIEKGLSRIGKPIDHIEKSMENTGKLEVYLLEKNLGILSTLASVAPMFGFLGTIFGMIVLFFDIQHLGFSIENIAGGIYTKMVTSAVGLIIGLLSYMAYRYLNAMINRKVNRMEAATVEFIDILQEPAK